MATKKRVVPKLNSERKNLNGGIGTAAGSHAI